MQAERRKLRIGPWVRATRLFRLINPIHYASDSEHGLQYEKEPYVIAADVGSVAPHAGRGGWTWYTGSAAWTWRLGVEAILGLRLREGRLAIDPCLPPDWGRFEAVIRGPAGALSIHVEDPERVGRGTVETTVDGAPQESQHVEFPTDGSVREVRVRLGPRLAGSPPEEVQRPDG